MPKKVIDKREYWLEDNRYRVTIESNHAYLNVPHYINLDSASVSISMEALEKLWELLDLVADDEWKPQPAKHE